jgi:hypothetical protein
MNGNEGHWGGGISIISQKFPKSPLILYHPPESSISQTSPLGGDLPGSAHPALPNEPSVVSLATTQWCHLASLLLEWRAISFPPGVPGRHLLESLGATLCRSLHVGLTHWKVSPPSTLQESRRQRAESKSQMPHWIVPTTIASWVEFVHEKQHKMCMMYYVKLCLCNLLPVQMCVMQLWYCLYLWARLVREVKLLGPLSRSIRSIKRRFFTKIIIRMDQKWRDESIKFN